MGGCATKPKVLNPETASRDPPAAPKENEEEDDVAVVAAGSNDDKSQQKAVGEVDGAKEIIVVDDDDDKAGNEEQGQPNNKIRRSLSHLFKENGGKELTEKDVKKISENKVVLTNEVEDNSETNIKPAEEDIIVPEEKTAKEPKAIEENGSEKVEEKIRATSEKNVDDLAAETGEENRKENPIPEEKKRAVDVKEGGAEESLPKSDVEKP